MAYVEVDAGKESPAHYHNKTEELYYIISAIGSITIGGQEFKIKAGDAIYLPVGAIHKIRSIGDGKLCLISADSPPYDPEDDIEV